MAAAAAAVAPLLVQLCPEPGAGEKLTPMRKLQSYFQSGKRSGGGECEVREGPEPGTYWVHFQQEQDRKNVESRTDHALELGGRRLKILIQRGEGDVSQSQLTEQASPSYSVPSKSSVPQLEQQAAESHGDTTTKKIFHAVSATLDTSMFTEEERAKITILCPNLKRERNPDMEGSERLTGDFTDIEKAYHYFKDILADNDPNQNFLRAESKNGLKDENDLHTEKMNEFQVPTACYEYFSHACKEQIETLCNRFEVRIRSEDCNNGNTKVCITSDSPASTQGASTCFVTAFQTIVNNLNQKKIPITNSYTLKETIMKLNPRFSSLLVKEEGGHLLLRGPASEISAAQKFLAEEDEKNQAEKNMKISSELYQYRNGIEVDASVFELLEPILSVEIEAIEHKFNTAIEKKDSSCGQKVLIIFRSRIDTSDMSSHATESFISALQSASATLRETISFKLTEDQKTRLNVPLSEKQVEDLHVELKKEDKLTLSRLCAAEEHIRNLPISEDSSQTKNRTPLSSDLSYAEATGASEKKYNSRQKNNPSSEGRAKAKPEEDKDKCPICLEKISNKEILRKCNHAFCKSCIDRAMANKQACPICNTVYGLMKGDQPDGTMSVRKTPSRLPGYSNCGTIVITYDMCSGIQTLNHPNPGAPYGGTFRIAYLPDNKEGREILQLLQRAFNQKLIFTVGQSRTTGAQNVITWNDIHHKTSTTGGPANFGYPDPDYLQRVRSELRAKGIE